MYISSRQSLFYPNKSFTLQNKGLHNLLVSKIWLSDLSKNKYMTYYRIRVLREVEGVRDRLAGEGVGADNTWVPRGDLGTDTGCMSEVELA